MILIKIISVIKKLDLHSLINFMEENKININWTDDEGTTLLTLILSYYYHQFNNATVDDELLLSLSKRKINIKRFLEWFVKNGGDINRASRIEKNNPIVEATRNYDYEMVAWLLENGADPNFSISFENFGRKNGTIVRVNNALTLVDNSTAIIKDETQELQSQRIKSLLLKHNAKNDLYEYFFRQ